MSKQSAAKSGVTRWTFSIYSLLGAGMRKQPH
jgi:hypothetical protein